MGNENILEKPESNSLFGRVVAILEQARTKVVRTISGEMVIAYWLIGREIVLELQKGDPRAEYGKNLIDDLSKQLNKKYGRGYSTTNLRYFRTFYQTYSDRIPEIRHLPCGESDHSNHSKKRHLECGVLAALSIAVEKRDSIKGFHPDLGWSHYRALMKVENKHARLFYEVEAAQQLWSVSYLERQIHSHLFERLLKSRDKKGVLLLTNEGQKLIEPIDAIKDPYVLDFLDLPDSELLHESVLESAIINNLQKFLLELGKGFSFVARQKRIRFEDQYFYIDLVFYNYLLKCFVLIDLKIGELTHQDIGQMDGYVRMYEDLMKVKGDKPTIGLILCSEKNEAIARYSVLHENKQLFASKYLLYLPTEKELEWMLRKERWLIEEHLITEQRGKAEKE
jgi:predicted nuclease of restriction endonuclease-like (RecB) superfamily